MRVATRRMRSVLKEAHRLLDPAWVNETRGELRWLGSLLGDRAPVKSHHHQGIGRIGEGLRVAAHAEDGTVEAVEDPDRRFARPIARPLGIVSNPSSGRPM